TNSQVKSIIAQKLNGSVDAALEVIRKRVDKFGVTQPSIQRLGNSARILVELPGAKDIDRVKDPLQSTAQLEFWHVYKFEEMAGFLDNMNTYLKNTQKAKNTAEEVTAIEADSTKTTAEDDAIAKLLGGENVLDSLAGS